MGLARRATRALLLPRLPLQAYDPTRAGANWTSWFNQISAIKSPYTPDYASLKPRQVGELSGKYDTQIAADWKTQVRGWSVPGNVPYRAPPS